VAIIGVLAVWFYLTRLAHPVQLVEVPGLKELIDEQKEALGPIDGPEGRVLFVFGLVAGLWILRGALSGVLGSVGLGGLTDANIAILGGLLLFMIPARLGQNKFLLSWEDVKEVPFGILILFGGGLALASGIESSGLAGWLAMQLNALADAPLILVLGLIVLLVIFLTEVTSNTSTATIFLPIVAVLATVLGVHPYVLMITVVTAASCAFMLPIATPPNAVVFASHYVTMRQMMKAGVWLNLAFVVLITLVGWGWLPVVWNLS